jgi:hypothetical protein
MNELNLEVGQKCWSIQLGECEVVFKDDKLIHCTNGSIEKEYYLSGKMFHHDHYRSLFLSNPFEGKPLFKNMDGFFDPKENKADTISALLMVMEDCSDTELKKIAREKLQKLLESL